jgi:hypothetical protein
VSAADLLEDALAALPTEPDEIARVFAELGIKGRPRKSCLCPVAKYLKAETGMSVIGVTPWRVYDYTCGGHVPVPDHVGHFISRFDLGDYPDLIEPTA